MDAPVDFALQEPGGFEHAKVFRNRGQRYIERFCQLRNHCFTAGQTREDGAARGISKRAKGSVKHAVGIVNHTVYY